MGRAGQSLQRVTALTLSALLASCGGRIYTGVHLHIGARPAAIQGTETRKGAAGLTLQFSTDRAP